MNSDRLNNSKLNIISNFLIFFLQSALSLIIRMIFIRKLGLDLLGLDSLCLNILSMLSIADLGISTAISYSLYRPLAENKIKKINAYMNFFKKIYRTIGFIILILGLIVMFFLKTIVGNIDYNHIIIIYLLYLFNTISLYFISYKDILLIADQKNYKIFKYNFFMKILTYILQILILIYTSNYVLYVLTLIVFNLADRILINKFITGFYTEVDFNSNEKPLKSELVTIRKNVSSLFLLKIGDYIVNCSDNIIISSIINVATVGIYTNYLSITSIAKNTIKTIFDSITASFGNLLTENDRDAEKRIFNIMNFIGFVIYGYITICLLNLINPFIKLWLGDDCMLSPITMILICINFYLMCNQFPLDSVKEAYGFYSKDKYVPIVQSIINIVLSISLGIKFGLNGIIIATSISYITTVFWSKPYLLYRYKFKESCIKYFINQLKYIIIITGLYFIIFNLINIMNLSSNFINLIIIFLIATIIYGITILFLFRKNIEFKFLKDFVKSNFIFNK